MRTQQQDLSSSQFVNPYTFVPFVKPDEWPVDNPWLRQPSGHDRIGDGRLSGLVEVEITARSPLLVRDGHRDAPGENTEAVERLGGRFPRRRVGTDGGEQPYIPGSAVAGVVRSLHESVVGGCLRVFDGGFRPGYRDVPKPRTGYWYMARVEQVDADGRPTDLTICPQTTWVPATWIGEALGGWRDVRTGATVRLRSAGRSVSFGSYEPVSRLQVSDPEDVERGNDWVLLLTDSGVRKTGPNATYFCAAGKLGSGPRPVAWADPTVWGDFLDAVEGSDDMRRARKEGRARQTEDEPTWIDVTAHPKQSAALVGRRIASRRRLFPRDQVVWVRLAERYQDQKQSLAPAPVTVEAIALAQIWRHSGGELRTRDRVPTELLPCQDVTAGLCPTCRVFGSAETEGSKTGVATQKSYRGHVRFSDGVLAPGPKPPSLETHLLPPLSAPRPGAGQFYLRQPQPFYLRDSTKKAPDPVPMACPQREWGSALDAKPRQLRGRKFYWLTGKSARRPFFRATRRRKNAFHVSDERSDGVKNSMLSRAEAVPAGVAFRCTVHFENLSVAELGGVLASLAPQEVVPLPEGRTGSIGFAMGGGRPLGFGSCTAEIVRLETYTARSRYAATTEDGPSVSPHDAVKAFRACAPKDQRKRVWPRLGHALCLDRVSPHHVWYPPAGELGEDEIVLEHLRPSMEFWKSTRGFRHQGKGRGDDALRPLPLLGDNDQALPVIPDFKAVQRRISQ